MRRRLLWLVLSAIVGAAAYAGTVLATTSVGFTGTTLARGQFTDINVTNKDKAADWEAELQTEGLSDLYVQSNVWDPLGSTGWHTHPGHSLIIVTGGAVTAYDASCTPTTYTKGMGFVDPGGDHVHLLRNEDAANKATTITVQMIPAGAIRRIDAPAPAGCSVF